MGTIELGGVLGYNSRNEGERGGTASLLGT